VMSTFRKSGQCAQPGLMSGRRTPSALWSLVPVGSDIEGQGAHYESRANLARPGCGVKT
jgi:hypothetical protein